MKLVSVGDLSLFLLLPLPGLRSAEVFLAPGFGGSLLESDLGLEEDEVPGPVQRCLLGAFFFLSIFCSVSALAFFSIFSWSLLTSLLAKAGLAGFGLVFSSTLGGAGFPVILALRSTISVSWSTFMSWMSLGGEGSLGVVDLTPSLRPPWSSWTLRSLAAKVYPQEV